MRGVVWLALGLSVSACTAEPMNPLEPVDTAADEIVNGQPALGDPAVVALTWSGQVFCTATLITPSIVLTAAHCLPPFNPVPASEIEVLFGTGPAIDELIPTHDAWSNPAWHDQNLADDFGLLQMTSIAEATPIPLNSTEVAVGTDVRLIGFGIAGDGQSDSGTKREGVGRVESQDAVVMDIERNPGVTCSGDSGGPTLVTTAYGEAVAGIHSSRLPCPADEPVAPLDGHRLRRDAPTARGGVPLVAIA